MGLPSVTIVRFHPKEALNDAWNHFCLEWTPLALRYNGEKVPPVSDANINEWINNYPMVVRQR